MKISYHWLKDYIDHPLSPQALGDALTMSGLELEEAISIGNSLEGVVVGHVLETRRHPNADRLTVCQVDLGGEGPVQIVCGAPNVEAGQKVPVATVGTTLMLPSRKEPGTKEPVVLAKVKLRGEASEGMICAEDELGLSDDHAGIMVLASEAAVGQPFESYLRSQGIVAHDTVLDLAVTPNRPDAISHIGIARDVAALTGATLKRPDVAVPTEEGEVAGQIKIEIQCPEVCHRYVGMLVKGVTIQESPEWLKQRITAIGLRPRNNIVDITNYVMYECGQPLHAFDADQIHDAHILVRLAEEGEHFTTLDSKDHRLPNGTILICDGARPVAIGGIMGGENSEVTDATTNVLIESAYFDPSTIRRAAKTLGISTDASYRFERGIDATGQAWAAARAAQLMVALGGGTLVPGILDVHPTVTPPRELILRIARIETILGVAIAQDEAARILRALGFDVVVDGAERLRCTVPSFRPDIEREIDLIEEVARIYGFNQIPEPPRSVMPHQTPVADPAYAVQRTTRGVVQGLGFREIYTNSMLPKQVAEVFNQPFLGGETRQGAIVETANPISQEMTTLRPSLLPGMLQVVAFNQNHGQDVLRFYEFGHVFHRTDRKEVTVPGYAEYTSFIFAAAGPATTSAWDAQARDLDFYDVKGFVTTLLKTLRLADVEMVPDYEETAVSMYRLNILVGGQHVGVIARLSERLQDQYDLRVSVFFAELDWSLLVAMAAPLVKRSYQAINRYPWVDRDLAVVLGKDEPVGPVLKSIQQAGQPLLQKTDVFDLYQGEHIDADKKSIAFSLRFGADRTLTDAEVDASVAGILKQLTETYGATLRQ